MTASPPRPASDADRARESRVILERVRQETDPQIGAGARQMMGGVLDHFAGRDADPSDRIEVLGTRIGRLLGLAAFVVLAFGLAATLLST